MLFFFQAEDGIRYLTVTGVQTCALPISLRSWRRRASSKSSAPLLQQRRRQLLPRRRKRKLRRCRPKALLRLRQARDRKSVVEGKRGDLRGRRIIKKKKRKNEQSAFTALK